MLEEKIDLLTKEIVALRKAYESGPGAAAPAAAAAADKPARGRPAKKADPVEPEHSAEEVEAIIRKVSKDVGKPVAKKLISGFKCDDLADLLTHSEHFDDAFTQAEALLEEPAGEEEEDI